MKSIVNFRDLGGYIGYQGKRVKERRILRSGELNNLASEDIDSLVKDYQLRNIIDFRRRKEVEEKPDDDICGSSYHHVDILKGLERSTSKQDLLESIHQKDADEGMMMFYQAMVLDEDSRKGYHDFLMILVNQEKGASIFHCFAGKDRTGVGAAIVLGILGVSDEEIMKDYLLTNEMRKEANEVILNQAKSQGVSDQELIQIQKAMSVNTMYLDTFIQTYQKEYGDFESFVEQGLGFSKDNINKLREIYLEDSSS